MLTGVDRVVGPRRSGPGSLPDCRRCGQQCQHNSDHANLGRVPAAALMLAAVTAPAALWPVPQTSKSQRGDLQVKTRRRGRT